MTTKIKPSVQQINDAVWSTGTRVLTFRVKGVQKSFGVNLFFRKGGHNMMPNGYEAFDEAGDNELGFYQDGELLFENNTLIDADGGYSLPRSVGYVLQSLGYEGIDSHLTRPLLKE